jgi:hypothetical protein
VAHGLRFDALTPWQRSKFLNDPNLSLIAVPDEPLAELRRDFLRSAARKRLGHGEQGAILTASRIWPLRKSLSGAGAEAAAHGSAF